MAAYRLLRSLLRLALRVFFRQIAVVGRENVPPEGSPVIFAGNHPNSLLDPVLIIATCGRIVHFAAKDVLFKNPLVRALITRLGAVPVARRSDHEGGNVDNSAAFGQLSEVLRAGRSMGIFPEGLSHDQASLSKLKTGAARIALDAVARGVPVKIVPSGLNYVRPKRFRSRVLVQYGAPLDVKPVAPGEDEREAARDLTARIEEALIGLTVNATDWDTLRVLDAVRRLYQPPRISLEERVELARRFSSVYARIKDQPDVAALYSRVEEWLARLDAAGIEDRDLSAQLSGFDLARKIIRNFVLLLIWLPLAAPGFVLHAPVVWVIRVAATRFAPRKDTTATTKLVLGLLLIPLSLLVTSGFVGWLWGWRIGLAALALLGLSGYATVRVLERGLRLRKLGATTVRMLSLRHELAELRAERDALEVEIVRAVERHIPSDMAPLFPRAALP